MSDRKHAVAMLEMAWRDVRAIQGMQHPALLDADFFSDEIFAFHAQQAVEKALKAWLSLKAVKYPHTHDLEDLIDHLADHGEDVSDLVDLVVLNPFAVQFRYESVSELAPVDRSHILARVQTVVEFVGRLIGG